jgi:penicillin amidase/acyl-homoserine-lactone acylase
MMRKLLWTIVWAAATAVALAAVVAGGLLLLDLPNKPARPDLERILAQARTYEARIRRDEWGVPHIRGRRDVDVAYGLAYAHSEDDFPTIAEVVLAARGARAGVHGAAAAPGDYLVHLLGVWPAVRARYVTDLPADVRAVLQAYADGLNHYGALNPEEVPEGVLPVTGQDIAAGFVLKVPLFYGLDETLTRLAGEVVSESTRGSNAVVVAPQRSDDGRTRLLVNSHQPLEGPVAWYEAVLQSDEGWHVAGGFFPGSPFMLHGHGARLGWANTVNRPDLIDVYRLIINPEDPQQYRLDGRWVDFERSEVPLRLRLWGPFYWTVTREVRRSVHGPVIDTPRGVFAVRYAGMNEIRMPLQYYRLNRARNLEEWRAALALQALPSINYLYADAEGNIGYVYNGLFPRRVGNVDWSNELPGDRSSLVWGEYRPFAEVPQWWNPSSGILFNANNTPTQASLPLEALGLMEFPADMGIETRQTNRGWRLLETYGADPVISDDEFRRYKFDLAVSPQSEFAAVIKDLRSLPLATDDAALRAAQQLLARWDLRTDQRNRAAALGVLAASRVLEARHLALQQGQPLAESALPEALRAAGAELTAAFGRIDPLWGDVNRLRRGKVDLPLDGGPDMLRAVHSIVDADGKRRAVAGDGFMMFVSWDRNGRLSSQTISPYGSASSRERSRHYADQALLFASQQTKRVYFTEAELAPHILEDYAPGKRSAGRASGKFSGAGAKTE